MGPGNITLLSYAPVQNRSCRLPPAPPTMKMGPTFNPHPNLPPPRGRDFISSPSWGRTKVGIAPAEREGAYFRTNDIFHHYGCKWCRRTLNPAFVHPSPPGRGAGGEGHLG